jgi:predicted nucleic acid-binding protein
LSTFFVDTSALSKRYLSETGSAWVLSWILPSAGNVIIVSDLAQVETISVFARLQREGIISAGNAVLLENNLLAHLQKEYLTIPLEASVLSQARQLFKRHPLRSLDSIQLACALWARTVLNEPMTFVSGDKRLLTAAATEGFATDDPNLHP